jgi:rubrerythrin
MSIQLSGADIIDVAVQIEVRGEGFYRAAAARAEGSEARQLFGHLGDEEVRHKRIFQALSPSIVNTEMDPATWDEAEQYIAATVDASFFSRADAPIRAIPEAATTDSMLRQAIEFEKQTLLYFYALRDLVHPANRPILDGVVAEEKSHVRRLAALLKA